MKIKKFLTVLLITVLLIAIAVSPLIATAAVFADEGVQTVEQIPAQEEQQNGGIENVTDGFVNYLKDRYGEDYQYYYDKIIKNWGSVEAYLLSFGEKLPEEKQTDWQKFVAWLSEYSSVWAPAFAVVIVIAVALFGKKQLNRIIKRVVNDKLKPIENELNLQSNAMVSVMHSQKALLGTGERFADSVKELEESEKGLKNG